VQNYIHILIVDDVHPSLMEALDAQSIPYSYQPTISAREVIKAMKDFNGLVVRSKINVDKQFLDANPQIVLVARAGSGLDNIDLDAASDMGVTCINSPEANCDAVGEQTTGMLLSLAHNIVKGNNEIAEKIWDREGNRGFEVGSKTIGIIGYGHTGSAVAKKLSGFGCEILAYDKFKDGFSNAYVQEVSLEKLMEESDVITFHVPLTNETQKWVANDFISKVKKPFVLLNLSRGGIMNTKDVILGLKSGKILGFGSDVLENEKMADLSEDESLDLETLIGLKNVIITPHVGGWTHESYRKISEVLVKKLTTWIRMSNNSKNAYRRNTHIVG